MSFSTFAFLLAIISRPAFTQAQTNNISSTTAVVATSTQAVIASTVALATPAIEPNEIYRKISPSVVVVRSFQGETGKELGAGVIIDNDGHVLTSAHLVIDLASGQAYDTIKVTINPSKITGNMFVDLKETSNAKFVRFDLSLDLAVLELEKNPHLSPIPWGDDQKMAVGDTVFAIGHPEQGGLWTMTHGNVTALISNLNRIAGKNVIQTTSLINRGNSGGPLMDQRGQVIGLNSSIVTKSVEGKIKSSLHYTLNATTITKWLRNEPLPTTKSVSNGNLPEMAKYRPIFITKDIPYMISEVIKHP